MSKEILLLFLLRILETFKNEIDLNLFYFSLIDQNTLFQGTFSRDFQGLNEIFINKSRENSIAFLRIDYLQVTTQFAF